MVTPVNASWKLPIAYFFIAGLNSEEKKQLLEIALKKLFEIGVRVVSVTCDGLRANFATFENLGASFDLKSLKCTFPHPSDPRFQVAVILDPCHLLKVARNTLGDLKILVDGDGNQIKFDNKISWKTRDIQHLKKILSKEYKLQKSLTRFLI